MPFRSQAQRGFLYANHPDVAAEFEAHTPKGAKLPAKIGKGDPMPDVGGKKFPYTPNGEKAAKSYSEKTGKTEKIAKSFPMGSKAEEAKEPPPFEAKERKAGKQLPMKGKGDAMSKSSAAKQAVAGTDMGKPGKNFGKIAASAGKEYGSAAAGKKVAGAIFQNMRKKGKL